eukprot:CAMPEP_0181303318 /NCGR_PEP_ID=MMETSP1101-20121128/8487_1 /TAXON_ID=46948 /ORGANISM="Rhodomonas abbreviata, Strain Caron Lab Isolate" /LENGTH=169 /DNA_ID=CAMNT_0023408869 /DNA_START=31 /DNA_END=540 /DNA_ORIENTATION=-
MVSDNTSIKASCFAGIMKMQKSSLIHKEEEVLPCALLDLDVKVKPAWKMLGARKMHREALSMARSDCEGSCSRSISTSSCESLSSCEETQTPVLSNRLAWNLLAHRHKQRMQLSASLEQTKSQAQADDCKRSSKEAVDYLRELELTCVDDVEQSCEALFVLAEDLNVGL